MSGVISGRVVDASGAPVAGASVAVTSSTVPVSEIAALTDAAGQFRRGELAPGDYTLEVRKTGLPPSALPVTVADGEQVNMEVRLGEPDVVPTNDSNDTPSESSGTLAVELRPQQIDWSQVRLVRVSLDYPGSGNEDATGQDFLLTPLSHDESTWQVPVSDASSSTYSYAIEYFMADGSRKSVQATDVSERTLVLDPVQ
jgi:hypothetical protein